MMAFNPSVALGDKPLRFSQILTESGWLADGVITVSGERIVAIESYRQFQTRTQEQLVMNDSWLLPGLIDSHVHGAKGYDVMDATHEALDEMSHYHAQYGVVAFLATTVTAASSSIKSALIQVRNSVRSGVSGAELLGSYLEGPYFTERNKGAHPSEWLRELDIQELEHWLSVADGTLKVVALAPEKSGSLSAIRYLKAHKVNVMLGHSDASYDQVQAAFDAGATGIVHCYNGMRGLHHRDPGVVGAGLCHPQAFVEMIADGHHVHPVAADVAHRCCGQRLVLISDAMRATGMANGQYRLGESLVTMKNGVVKTDSGGLAGSTLKLCDGVNNLSRWLEMPLEKAWMLGSSSPARALGISADLGSIAVGKKASVVAVSEQGDIQATWVLGKCAYSKATKQKNLEVPCI
ncbi:N-acetylglucosamine-6-phosphate deacetylase [Photobacterium kasasachensis]|uniref:N-acetylglucosamine-6-phosphate deacetylase n=1 Tax=Photobacterium kasasachensis TaxID=2910240 RepID=UPI003D14747D